MGCVRVSAGVRSCVRVCTGGSAWVWARVIMCGRVCTGVHGCVHVCGMNFQNFFQRIESLHQRTLIRILYEFFIFDICCSYLVLSVCQKINIYNAGQRHSGVNMHAIN